MPEEKPPEAINFFKPSVIFNTGISSLELYFVSKPMPASWLIFSCKVILPNMDARPLRMTQTGPGRYEASFDVNDDGNYLISDLEGKGQFVGVNYFVHSPGPMWYGEGDDMIFIDGEDWPSGLHGTGTEDYFNTSWCPDTLYSHPYYGYARVNDDIGWMGRTHVYRFHIADPLYFDESLRFSIEHGHNNNLTLDLATVAYWYQTGPHKPFPAFPDRESRAPMPMISTVEIHRWRDAWRKAMGNGSELWGTERKPGGGGDE